METNLNNAVIPIAIGDEEYYKEDSKLKDLSTQDGDISVYFRNLEKKLIEHINNADAVLGCVAWLTSFPILDALAKKQCSIVVQKEDFLRPDQDRVTSRWHKQLHDKYDSLEFLVDRFNMAGTILPNISYCADCGIEPVRCVGNHNRDKSPASPRMHNKFMVFAKLDKYEHFDPEGVSGSPEYGNIRPYAVWSGSFNFTKNAGYSLENALYITNSKIVEAYYQEYGQIMALSETLDWTSDWVAPEWRLGS